MAGFPRRENASGPWQEDAHASRRA